MKLKFTTIFVAVAKKGAVMEINSKKNHLSRILIMFIMLLLAMGLTMNVLFCNHNNLYKLIENRSISERIVSNENGDDIPSFKTSFLNKNNSHTETITKNIYPIPMIAAIPKGISLLLSLNYIFLFYYSTLFTLLPDEWTLINQKVRLDD